jgi:hypothetical protein
MLAERNIWSGSNGGNGCSRRRAKTSVGLALKSFKSLVTKASKRLTKFVSNGMRSMDLIRERNNIGRSMRAQSALLHMIVYKRRVIHSI